MSPIDSSVAGRAARYAALDSRKKRVKALLERIQRKMTPLEEELSDAFIEAGLSLVKVDGATVHILPQTWPALVVPAGMTKEEARLAAVHTLEQMGHTAMVTFNSQSVRGLLNNFKTTLADGSVAYEIPEPLASYIRAETKYRIGVRGGKKPRGKTMPVSVDDEDDFGL